MLEEISLTDTIEVSPVGATGGRWTTPREKQQAEDCLRRFSGGMAKFSIRRDPSTGFYLTLGNSHTGSRDAGSCG